MTIQSRFFFSLSVLLLAVFGYFVFSTMVFLGKAEKTQGVVTLVQGNNDTCSRSCGRRCRRHYDCTKFSARVEFKSRRDELGGLWISAGQARGHGSALILATLRVGDRVPVLFNPNNLTDCRQDALFAVWGKAIMTLVGLLVTLILSFVEPRRRTAPGTYL